VDDPYRDRLPVNPPYSGWIADAYEAWIPLDAEFPGDVELIELVAGAGAPALELGCGPGRFLLRALAAGHTVEGIDDAPEMLERCRANATRAGWSPVLHLGDMAALALGRRYGAVVCPAGSFTLVDRPERVERALRSYHQHLLDGGRLGLALSTIEPPRRPYAWRLRRTGTGPDGTTYVVHEALGWDQRRQVEIAYQRNERYDPHGRLIDTLLRVHHLRSWTRQTIEAALVEAGFSTVEHRGGGPSWVTVAMR
jgi:SAM-dependent methyltransferase